MPGPLYVVDFVLALGLAADSQAGCRRFDPGLPLQFPYFLTTVDLSTPREAAKGSSEIARNVAGVAEARNASRPRRHKPIRLQRNCTYGGRDASTHPAVAAGEISCWESKRRDHYLQVPSHGSARIAESGARAPPLKAVNDVFVGSARGTPEGVPRLSPVTCDLNLRRSVRLQKRNTPLS